MATSGGLEKFEALSVDEFDLIVLNLNLPDGDGLDFAQHIRTAGDIPILVASTRSATEDRIKALNLWNIDYLTKPFDPKELLLRVLNMLQLTQDRAPGAPSTLAAPTAPVSVRRIRFTPLALGLLVLVIALEQAWAAGTWA